MLVVVTTSPPQCYGFRLGFVPRVGLFRPRSHDCRLGRVGPEPLVGWELGSFRHGQNPPFRSRGCAGANSRKLDKQIVLPKKVIRLLTNLRILDSLRCIESRKQDARWCDAGREENAGGRVRRHGRFKVLIFGRWEEITSSTKGKHRKREFVCSSQEQEWALSWWRSPG